MEVSSRAGISFESWIGEGYASLLAEFSSWRVVGLRASVPCRLLAGGHPQFLALWAIPSWQLVVVSEARENLDACSQGLCSLLGEVRSGSRKQSATMYITEYN